MTTASAMSPVSISLPGVGLLTGPVARALFSVPFAISGAMHFVAAGPMAAIVPAWLPGGVLWVYFTGVALLAGAIGIHLRRWALPAGLGLAALMLVFAFVVHAPGLAAEATRQMAMVGFLKDLGLAGGALAIALTHRPAT